MARVPDIIRRNAISQVAKVPAQTGHGWAALANLAQAGAEFIKPAVEKQAQEEGLKATYRDENGVLKVKEKNVLGGFYADIHNSAAYAMYLAKSKIDMSESFTELARKFEFDPAGFKEASDAYIKSKASEPGVPSALKEELVLDAQQEASRRFNGLYDQQTDRTYRETNRNTSTARDMMVDDYVNLYMGGDLEAAEAKYAEIEAISKFRENAPYISETPAEREAFLRGVRGSAKAAALTQRLSETMGDTDLSKEFRQEIEDVLKDPDIDPDTRRRLYVATQGRLKGIDANAIVDGLTNDSYAAKVVRVESGGKSSAANPNSSALGPHQFLKGTWLENVKELRAQGKAQWSKGLTESEILLARTSPEASAEVFDHFRRKNAAVLQKAGLPVDEATEYMAHFFGAGGAVQVLTSDPTALISEILPEVVKANPFMKNMTAHDARNWAARKMTMKASDIILQQQQIDLIDDTEVRAMASSALSDRFKVRKRFEDASALEYEERLTARDDTLTEQEIREDHRLADSTQKSIVAELQRLNADKIAVQQTIGKLNNPATIWDPFDTKQNNAVDDAYKSMLGDEHPLSEPGQLLAGEIALKRGSLPKTSFNALRAAVKGNDPAAFASAVEFANQVLQRQPGALDMHGNRSDVTNALSDYGFLSQFMGAEEAAARVIELNSPEAVANRKNLSDAAKEAKKSLDPKDIVAHFEDKDLDVDLGTDDQRRQVMSDYETLFEKAYLETGDAGLAKNRALNDLDRSYGPNEITGNSRLMKFPPQNFYPRSQENPEWMRLQLVMDVSKHAYGDKALDPSKGVQIVDRKNMGLVPFNRIVMVSDEGTRADVAAKRDPRYQVYYMNDENELTPVPGRYRFDPARAMEDDAAASRARKEEFEADRSSTSEATNLRLWRDHMRMNMGMTDVEARAELEKDRESYALTPPPQE